MFSEKGDEFFNLTFECLYERKQRDITEDFFKPIQLKVYTFAFYIIISLEHNMLPHPPTNPIHAFE